MSQQLIEISQKQKPHAIVTDRDWLFLISLHMSN